MLCSPVFLSCLIVVHKLQRVWLHLWAVLDYMEIFKPQMDGLAPPSQGVHNTVWCYTNSIWVAQDMYTAGLVGWFNHLPASLTRKYLVWGISFILETILSWSCINLSIWWFSKDLQHPWESTRRWNNLLVIFFVPRMCFPQLLALSDLPPPCHHQELHHLQCHCHCRPLQLLPPVQLDSWLDEILRVISLQGDI